MTLKYNPNIPMIAILVMGLSFHPMAQSDRTTSIPSGNDLSGSPTTAYLSSLKGTRIQLDFPKEPSASRFASLFHHFEIWDVRPDTSRIGVMSDRTKAAGSYNRQLVFARPASEEITTYLDARFAHPGEAYTALVVLRTLWLSDANNVLEELVRNPEKFNEKSKIRLKAEIYAEKDGEYIPLYRFDSLQITVRNTHTLMGKDLSGMLEQLADSATLVLAQKGGEGRKISRAAILEFNQSRFDLSTGKDNSLSKGVYRSFEEFKNNTPAAIEGEIKKEKGNNFLYLKETDGHLYYTHSVWGYCDGKNVYIMNNGTLEPAWREGNAWYFFGQVRLDPKKQGTPKLVAPVEGPAMNSSAGLAGNLALSLLPGNIGNADDPYRRDSHIHIFTVDMDTGKLY